MMILALLPFEETDTLSNLLIIPFICKMFNKVEKEHKNPLFYEAKILQIYLENGATNSCNPFPRKTIQFRNEIKEVECLKK